MTKKFAVFRLGGRKVVLGFWATVGAAALIAVGASAATFLALIPFIQFGQIHSQPRGFSPAAIDQVLLPSSPTPPPPFVRRLAPLSSNPAPGIQQETALKKQQSDRAHQLAQAAAQHAVLAAKTKNESHSHSIHAGHSEDGASAAASSPAPSAAASGGAGLRGRARWEYFLQKSFHSTLPAPMHGDKSKFLIPHEISLVIRTVHRNHERTLAALRLLRPLVARIFVFSDVYEEDFGSALSVVSDPHPHWRRTARSSSAAGWMVGAVLGRLAREEIFQSKFYLFMDDSTFPLLDRIGEKLKEFSADHSGRFPDVVAGSKSVRKADSSACIWRNHCDTVEKKFGAAELKTISPFLFGLSHTTVDYLADIAADVDGCPPLAQDDLALAALFHCAGGWPPDTLTDFIPQTRRSPTQAGLNEESSVEEWRSVLAYHALQSTSAFQDAFIAYWSKALKHSQTEKK